MRNFTAFSAVLLVITAFCWSASAADDKNDNKVEMQPAVDFPHAGISLAVPVKFALTPINDSYGVMAAVLVERNEAKVSMLLSAFPAAKEETADTYASGMYKNLESCLGITKVTLLKKITTKVAGIDSVVQLFQYTFHNSEMHSVRVFFVREQADPPVRVCYMLEIQTPPGNKELLVPTLRGVIDSVKMIPFTRPDSIPVTAMTGQVYNYRGRFCVSVPCGWQVVRDDNGNLVVLTQSNYLGGDGIIAGVSIDKVGADETPQEYARKMIEAVKAAKDAGIAIEVLSEGQAKMGEMKAYQLVIRKKIKATDETPESLKLIIQRIICVPPLEEGFSPRAYIMHMEMPDTDPKVPLTVMDKLADDFRLLDAEGMPIQPNAATTRPATSQPATSQPAASQPADKNSDAVEK